MRTAKTGERSIRRTIAATTIATVLGSAAGVVLPFILTANVSTRESDAYFLATGALLTGATIVTSVLKGVTVPFFISWRASDGDDSAWYTARRLIIQSSVVTTVITIAAVAALNAAALPAADLSGDKRFTVLMCSVALAPLPLIMTYNSVLSALLYGLGKFGVATWSEAARSVTGILAALLIAPETGVVAVSAALWVGEAVRALVLRRLCLSTLNLSRSAERRVIPVDTFWRVAGTQVFSMSIVGISPLIDKAFAAGQGDGAVTTLELAERVFYTPLVLLSTGIGLVVGTSWAHAAQRGAAKELQSSYRRWNWIFFSGSAIVAIVATITVVSLEDLAIDLLHLPERFSFALVFACFAIGLPFAMSASLGSRLFVACRDTRLLPAFAAVLLVFNILGDWIGVTFLGVAGIALASSACRLVSALLYACFAGRVMRSAVATAPSN